MIKISVFGRKLRNIELEPLVSGNDSTFDVVFDFRSNKSEIWKNAELSAVFRIITNIGAAQTIAPVPLDFDNRCSIPLSVLKEPCYKVYLCLYGNFSSGRTVVSESVQIGKTVFGISNSELNSVCDEELKESLYDLLLGKINEVKMSIPQALGNKDVLTKFSEDSEGNLYYGDKRLAGLPSGGTEGQVLEKKSDKDYDYGWGDSVTLEYNAGSLKIF